MFPTRFPKKPIPGNGSNANRRVPFIVPGPNGRVNLPAATVKPKPAKGKAKPASEARKGKGTSVSRVAPDLDRKPAALPLRTVANNAIATKNIPE